MPVYALYFEYPRFLGLGSKVGDSQQEIRRRYTRQEQAQADGWTHCSRRDGGSDQWLTGPASAPADATELAVAVAEQQLTIPLPTVTTSPPRGGQQLVGVPVWFWLADHRPTDTTAQIPGLSATLIATPTTTTHTLTPAPTDQHPHDKATTVELTCQGPGQPYDPQRHDPRDTSDCSAHIDWPSTYTVETTTHWDLAWTASNGTAGTLPPVTRTSSFTLTVQEAQAVTD